MNCFQTHSDFQLRGANFPVRSFASIKAPRRVGALRSDKLVAKGNGPFAYELGMGFHDHALGEGNFLGDLRIIFDGYGSCIKKTAAVIQLNLLWTRAEAI